MRELTKSKYKKMKEDRNCKYIPGRNREELQKHKRNKSQEKSLKREFRWHGDFVVKIEEED